MRLITFDPLRSIGLTGARYVKPALLMQHLDDIAAADWLVFPDYADVALLVHALGRRIFPSLATYQLAFDKVEMTRALTARFPAHVPETVMQPNTPSGRTAVLAALDFPFVAKIPRSSRGEGVRLIGDAASFEEYCAVTPTLYAQERLPITRDLRVVWVGDAVVDAYWRVASEGAFHNNLAQGASIERTDVPDVALDLVGRIARAFGIDHAGFDLALVDGHPFVFEFNRLFGLQGLNERGLQPGALIEAYLARRAD